MLQRRSWTALSIVPKSISLSGSVPLSRQSVLSSCALPDLPRPPLACLCYRPFSQSPFTAEKHTSSHVEETEAISENPIPASHPEPSRHPGMDSAAAPKPSTKPRTKRTTTKDKSNATAKPTASSPTEPKHTSTPHTKQSPNPSPPAQPPPRKRETWQVQKTALMRKFAGTGWAPRKRLSPEALDGIRALHASDPVRFSTPALAARFEVSPEAIRRILRSRWRPTDEEHEERMRRWDRRGKAIWEAMVEKGAKPPKKWRVMGVGRVGKGEVPRWKRRKEKAEKMEKGGNLKGRDTGDQDEDVPWEDQGSLSVDMRSAEELPQRVTFGDRIV